ncbi:MAG: RNA polymerase sigma factor [Planctomyces sp.]|jgi:RNA polymerase sigma factor (sigma-70 family)
MICEDLCKRCDSLLQIAWHNMQKTVAATIKINRSSAHVLGKPVQPVGVSLEQLKPLFCEAVEAVKLKREKKENHVESRESIAGRLVLKDLFWARSSTLGDGQAAEALLFLIENSVAPLILQKFQNRPAQAFESVSALAGGLFAGSKPKGGSPVSGKPRLDSYCGEGTLKSWLIVVAVRDVLSALRTRRDQQFDEAVDSFPTTDGVDDNIEAARAALIKSVIIAVLSLPAKKKLVFVLRIMCGKTNQETARILNIRESTASESFRSAKELIRKHPDVHQVINELAEATGLFVANIDMFFDRFIQSLEPVSPDQDSDFRTGLEPFLN